MQHGVTQSNRAADTRTSFKKSRNTPPHDDPVGFIDSLNSSTRHVALFHEGSNRAREVEMRFLLNGLAKGENCSFGTVGSVKTIENNFVNKGVDFDRYNGSGLLRVFRLADPRDTPKNLRTAFNSLHQDVFRLLTSPFRMVVDSRVPDLRSKAYIAENIRAERAVSESINGVGSEPAYSALSNKKGILLCSYDTRKLVPELHADWFLSILQSHNAAVFVPKHGSGSGFKMR